MSEQGKPEKQEQVGIALSLLTIPFLGGLTVARSMSENLISLGEASEEIFRGDRLPILNLQQQNEIEIKE